jgi:hypothetical protein
MNGEPGEMDCRGMHYQATDMPGVDKSAGLPCSSVIIKKIITA